MKKNIIILFAALLTLGCGSGSPSGEYRVGTYMLILVQMVAFLFTTKTVQVTKIVKQVVSGQKMGITFLCRVCIIQTVKE